MIDMKLQQVEVLRRYKARPKNQTIADDTDLRLDDLITDTHTLCAYRRDDEWIVDFTLSNGEILCLKLPGSMSDADFEKWFKPAIDIFELSIKEKV